MKIRRTACWMLSVGVMLGLTPRGVWAQATTGTGTSSAANTGSTGASGGTGSAVGNAAVNLSASTGLVQPVPILAITNTGASTTTSPSSLNPFYYTFVNPMSLGLPSIYATNLGPPSKYTGTLGKGLYLSQATTTSSSTGSTTSNAGVGFGTQPTPRSPSYITVLGEGLAPRAYPSTKVAAEARQKFANSSFFKKGDAIQVEAANGVVLLRGPVASESERIRAEGMMRIMPGVNDVQNQLQIVPVSN